MLWVSEWLSQLLVSATLSSLPDVDPTETQLEVLRQTQRCGQTLTYNYTTAKIGGVYNL